MVDRYARWRQQMRWILLAFAGFVLVAHSLVYNFVTDDAYISFVYSRNFAEHGELAFNLGDPVEGYTNFSWTVLLGMLLKVGIVPEISSRVLGTLCALGTLYLVMRTMERALGRKTVWAVVPSLLLACSAGFACWTSGGLETQLFTVLVVGALDAVVAAVAEPRALRRAAICLALAAMTRPEGPLVAAVLGAVWLAHLWFERRTRVPLMMAIEKSAPNARLVRVVATAAALLFVCAFLGAISVGASYRAFATGIDVPVLPLIVLGGLLGIPLFGLFDAARAARGNQRALRQIGVALLVVGGLTMLGAIRSGVALADVVTWNRAVPIALLAIVVGSAALGLAFTTAQRLRAELIAAAWFVGLWVPWFLWRWWYYGYPFPNTYYVKAAGPWTNPEYGSQMLGHGFHYVWVWLVQSKLLYAAPLLLLGLFVNRPRTPRFVLGASAALLLLVYLAYTISVGGDFMGLHRFIMPLFVLAAIAVVLGLEWLTRFLPEEQVVFPGSLAAVGAAVLVFGCAVVYAIVVAPNYVASLSVAPLTDPRIYLPVIAVGGTIATLIVTRGRRRGIAAAAVNLLVCTFATSQFELTARSISPQNLAADRGVIDTPAFLMVYTEDRAKIGRAMAPCFREDDFSIVGGAGAQPYFGKMRGIDVFGLVSDKIAHREPRSRARSGHTKWGSEALLAEYDPDFIFSCYRIHKTPAQPQLPCAGFWLRRGFEHVTLRIPGMIEQGEYYTFLAKKERAFQCTNRVR